MGKSAYLIGGDEEGFKLVKRSVRIAKGTDIAAKESMP